MKCQGEIAHGVITVLVNKYLAPVLNAAGYRRLELVWKKPLAGLEHVIDLQVSRWSDQQEVRFTLNFGVLIEQVWRTCWDDISGKRFEVSDCFPRFRISYVLRRNTDMWWIIKSVVDVDKVGPEVQSLLVENCIPFMNNLNSLESIATTSRDPALRKLPYDNLCFAILMHLVGSPKDTELVLNKLLQNQKLIGWHERVKRIQQKLLGY